MPHLVTRGLRGGGLVTDGLRGGSGVLPPYVEDPWLAFGYNATVAVEYDANATGGDQTTHGWQAPRYVPVRGLQSLKVVLVREANRSLVTAANDAMSDRPQMTRFWKALYGRPVAFDSRHRFVWSDDPLRAGRKRYLEVIEPSEKIGFRGHQSVKLVERFNAKAG